MCSRAWHALCAVGSRFNSSRGPGKARPCQFSERRRWPLHVRCRRKNVHVRYLIYWWVLVHHVATSQLIQSYAWPSGHTTSPQTAVNTYWLVKIRDAFALNPKGASTHTTLSNVQHHRYSGFARRLAPYPYSWFIESWVKRPPCRACRWTGLKAKIQCIRDSVPVPQMVHVGSSQAEVVNEFI